MMNHNRKADAHARPQSIKLGLEPLTIFLSALLCASLSCHAEEFDPGGVAGAHSTVEVGDSMVRHRCVGATTPGETKWRDYRPERPGSGLVATIDTSACRYSAVPIYLVSMGGRTGHWSARGVASIYHATPQSFDVFVDAPMTAEEANNVQNFGNKLPLAWNVQWEAHPPGPVDPVQCAGQTTPGATRWQEDGAGGLVLDVDAEACGFEPGRVPSYFTALGSTDESHKALGHTAILNPSARGFSIRIPNAKISVVEAQKRWHLNWNGVAADAHERSRAACTGQAGTWKPYRRAGAYYIDVDTSHCEFHSTPRYFTSLTGRDSHWVLGSQAIYFARPNGFRVYVRASGASPSDFSLSWKAVPQSKKRALWIWEDDTLRLLDDAEYADATMTFLQKHQIGTAYLYAGDQIEDGKRRGLDTEAQKYRRLIRQFHDAHIEVHALLGSERLRSERWALVFEKYPHELHQKAVDAVRQVAEYNEAQSTPARFDGVQLAILPHNTEEWDDSAGGEDRHARILTEYLAMAEKLMAAAPTASTGPIGAAVPWWWSHSVEFAGTTRRVYEHALELYDYVTLLVFQDSWQSIASLASGPIRYAASIDKPLVLGVETHAPRELAAGPDGEPAAAEQITFCEEGPETLERHLAQGGSQAFAIHDFRWYQSLWSDFADDRCAIDLLDVHGAEPLRDLEGIWLVPAKGLHLSAFGLSPVRTATTSFTSLSLRPGPVPSFAAGFTRAPIQSGQTVYTIRSMPFRTVDYLVIGGFGPKDEVAFVGKFDNGDDYFIVVTEEAAITAGEFDFSIYSTFPQAKDSWVELTEWQ